MKRLILLLYLGLSGLFAWPTLAASATAEAPQRIVSINLCADQLLLLLADKTQISALTHLAHEPPASYFYAEASTYPTTQGLAEDILPFKPDLVITGEYGHWATVQLLQKLGVRVETLPMPNTMEGVFSNLRQMAQWVGHAERAEPLIATMQQRLAALPSADAQPPLAAVYDPNGYTVGAETLRGQMIRLAGWRNAGEVLGITHYGALSLEAMVRLKPDALIESPYSLNTYSRAEALAQHPALRRTRISPTIISIPSRLTICEGPWSVDVIETLAQARLRWQAAQPHEKRQ